MSPLDLVVNTSTSACRLPIIIPICMPYFDFMSLFVCLVNIYMLYKSKYLFIYSCVPMGLKVSQNLLNLSVIHIFSTMNDVMLYSDNILLLSKNTKDHYQLIKQVFSKLREHGLKIQASKTSLFINKLIKLTRVFSGPLYFTVKC